MSPVWKAAHSWGLLHLTGSLAKYLALESSLKASGRSFYNKDPEFLTLRAEDMIIDLCFFCSVSSWLSVSDVSQFTFFFFFFFADVYVSSPLPRTLMSCVLKGHLLVSAWGDVYLSAPHSVCWLGKASEMSFCLGSLKA